MGIPSSDSAGIRQAIRATRAAGYVLDSVWDGEESTDVSNENDAVETILAVDDATLYFTKPGHDGSPWIRFVMGNDPEEVICDHTMSLEHVLGPLMDSWWED